MTKSLTAGFAITKIAMVVAKIAVLNLVGDIMKEKKTTQN